MLQVIAPFSRLCLVNIARGTGRLGMGEKGDEHDSDTAHFLSAQVGDVFGFFLERKYIGSLHELAQRASPGSVHVYNFQL